MSLDVEVQLIHEYLPGHALGLHTKIKLPGDKAYPIMNSSLMDQSLKYRVVALLPETEPLIVTKDIQIEVIRVR